jgi:DNA-binding NarL/FixJ family response regulator
VAIRVLIAEDHPVVRSGLRLLLGDQEDIQIVAEAATGLEAIELLRTITVDLVLMDISMPDLNGLEATKHIRRTHADLPVLVLTMHQDERYFFQILKAGANGYIVKGAAPGDLVSAVRAVAAGEAYLYPSLASCLAKEPEPSLSPREVEVLQLTAQGLTAREVSGQLCISPNTVERHRANIMSKLGLSNRSELIRYALDRGILDAG